MRRSLILLLVLPLGTLQAQGGPDASQLLAAPLDLPRVGDTIRGQLRPRQFTILAAGLAARISRFDIHHGDHVQEGQLLAELDCRMELAEKSVAQAKLQAAETRLQVNEKLEKLDNISVLDVRLSRADAAIARAELKRIDALLTACKVKAPFSGVITAKHAQAHQYINTGEPLMELVDTASLEVEMVLPSVKISQLPAGTPFQIRLDETGDVVNARIDRVVGAIDPVSQTARFIGSLMDPPANLLPGMSGTVTLSGGTDR